MKDEGSYSFVYWKHEVCYVVVAMRLVEVNLGDRGKYRKLKA